MLRITARFMVLSLLTLPAFGAQAVSNTAGMAGNWYAGLSGDFTWLHGDTGGGGNAQLGYMFPSDGFGDLRLEGEFGYHDASSTHYFTYMGNAYYDFGRWAANSGSVRIVPYLGAGVGDATVHFQRNGSGDALAYQGMAGLSFICASMPNTDWSLGYRYQGSDETHGSRLNANNIELGVRFHL